MMRYGTLAQHIAAIFIKCQRWFSNTYLRIVTFQVLKDILNRYKLLRGYHVEYVPGWDCHGTPIEQKALAELKTDHSKLTPMEIRKKGNVNNLFVYDVKLAMIFLYLCVISCSTNA